VYSYEFWLRGWTEVSEAAVTIAAKAACGCCNLVVGLGVRTSGGGIRVGVVQWQAASCQSLWVVGYCLHSTDKGSEGLLLVMPLLLPSFCCVYEGNLVF
jgi:hypothetical protein